jgi:hypothetical protein
MMSTLSSTTAEHAAVAGCEDGIMLHGMQPPGGENCATVRDADYKLSSDSQKLSF